MWLSLATVLIGAQKYDFKKSSQDLAKEKKNNMAVNFEMPAKNFAKTETPVQVQLA